MLRGIMITQKRLKQLVKYNKRTGLFTNKVDRMGSKKGKVLGYLNTRGYVTFKIDGIQYKAHRLAWLYIKGRLPTGVIDHKNHIKNDNRFKNLRDVTNEENSHNLSIYSNNTSGTTGISFDNSRNKWKVSISVNRKLKNIGRFDDLELAIFIRKEAEDVFNYHKNCGVESV